MLMNSTSSTGRIHMARAHGPAVSVITTKLFMSQHLPRQPGRHMFIQQRILKKAHGKTSSFSPSFHDNTLFFDDDGRVYLIYGNKKLTLVELNDDLSGVKTGGTNQVIIENSSLPSGNDSGLGEGSQLFKVNGIYFLFNITWPRGGMRTVVIHRADKITGPWEGRLAFQDLGVAQGGMVDTP